MPAAASPLVSSVLPTSRSVQVGNTATMFAAIINSGATALNNCAIAPVTPISGSFLYQTTDPSNNALTGSANTPANIPAHGLQTFVIAITANGAFTPTNVQLGYSCVGAPAAATITGLNSVLLTFDNNPVADMIAVGLTPSNDGFARTGGPSGIGLFAIASSNIGGRAR